MSYDLWFWKQSKACRHRPDTVARRVCEGGTLTGVAELDLDAIEARIAETFPGYKNGMYDKKTRYFTFDRYPPHAFQVVSNPPETNKQMEMLNTLIDVASEFGCSLYDPQTGERYG